MCGRARAATCRCFRASCQRACHGSNRVCGPLATSQLSNQGDGVRASHSLPPAVSTAPLLVHSRRLCSFGDPWPLSRLQFGRRRTFIFELRCSGFGGASASKNSCSAPFRAPPRHVGHQRCVTPQTVGWAQRRSTRPSPSMSPYRPLPLPAPAAHREQHVPLRGRHQADQGGHRSFEEAADRVRGPRRMAPRVAQL